MTSASRRLLIALTTVVLSLAATTTVALGHPGHPSSGNALTAGTLHPLLGLDHLLAAVASGLLAVRIGTPRAFVVIPATFTGFLLAGGALAASGLAVPPVEWGIAFSVIVLGLVVAMVPTVPVSAAAALAALFAACHGYAHVAEMSAGQALPPYLFGLAATTLALHGGAIAVGLLGDRAQRAPVVRCAGALIAAGFLLVLATS